MSIVQVLDSHLAEARNLHKVGALAQAESMYREILAANPNLADAWNLYGLLAHQRGASATAVQMMAQAIELAPKDASYRVNFAEAQRAMGQVEAAIAALREAIALEPDLVVAHGNLANVLYESCRHEEALGVCTRALELDGNAAWIWSILGNVHEALGDHEAARSAFWEAIARDGEAARPWANLAVTLERMECLQEALEACDRALFLDPDHGDVRLLRALLLLKSGDFERGWKAYEDRWISPTFLATASPWRGFSQPLWQGEGLVGTRILVHAEQGFGDTLQFIRFAPILASQGAEVHVECPSEMLRLFQRIPGLASVRAAGEALPEVDFQVPLLSCPRGFGITLSNIPHGVPYLKVNAEARERWGTQLGCDRPRVGLVWAGRPDPKEYRSRRAMKLAQLSRLFLETRVTWVSLQKGAGVEEIANSGFPLLDFSSEILDFDDLAALVDSLDLVITIDTAVAHLAGALGKPTWVMLPRPSAYQWMLGREDSPWYPSMRLFRQCKEGDWVSVISHVIQELNAWLEVRMKKASRKDTGRHGCRKVGLGRSQSV